MMSSVLDTSLKCLQAPVPPVQEGVAGVGLEVKRESAAACSPGSRRSRLPALQAPGAPGSPRSRLPALQAARAPGSRFPALQAPGAPGSPCSRLPALQARGAPGSPRSRLPALRVPRAPGSRRSGFPALQAPGAPGSRRSRLPISRLTVLQASCAMNSNQPVPLGQINRAFSPPNYELLSEERTLLTPEQDPASTIINIHSYEAPPKDFFVWSVFNTLYMNFCCLGFMALVFSVKARDRKVAGDLNGAQSYGSTAKCLNIFALIFSLLLVILFIVLLATGIIIIKHEATNLNENAYLSDLFPGN